MEKEGQKQYNKCIDEKLRARPNNRLKGIIYKNQFCWFSVASTKQQSKTKQQIPA